MVDYNFTVGFISALRLSLGDKVVYDVSGDRRFERVMGNILNSQSDKFPYLKHNIHFSDSRTGLICVEMQDILYMACNSELIEMGNPGEDYKEGVKSWEFLISRGIVSRFLQEHRQGSELERFAVEVTESFNSTPNA